MPQKLDHCAVLSVISNDIVVDIFVSPFKNRHLVFHEKGSFKSCYYQEKQFRI